MKTTLDLPDALVKEVKFHALRKGQKLKEAVADLIRKGLDAPPSSQDDAPSPLTIDRKTGLPLIKCRHPAPPGEELTPQRVADILIHQEAAWHAETGG